MCRHISDSQIYFNIKILKSNNYLQDQSVDLEHADPLEKVLSALVPNSAHHCNYKHRVERRTLSTTARSRPFLEKDENNSFSGTQVSILTFKTSTC